MNNLTEFLASIPEEKHRQQLATLLEWILTEFPELTAEIKWNQPMFTEHGTYIIGFSVAKPHFAIGPETVTIRRFAEQIQQAGYAYTDNIIKVKWGDEIDYALIGEMIRFNRIDKADSTRFWR